MAFSFQLSALSFFGKAVGDKQIMFSAKA